MATAPKTLLDDSSCHGMCYTFQNSSIRKYETFVLAFKKKKKDFGFETAQRYNRPQNNGEMQPYPINNAQHRAAAR